MKKIEFGELHISDLGKKHLQDCIDTNWVTMGPKVKQFEEEWKNLFGYKHTVMVNSGTSADIAACIALYSKGAKPGDEIICPALGFIAAPNAIRAAGFKPVFVDVELDSLNINIDLVEEAITEKTAGILTINTMGKPSRMDILQEIAKNNNLSLISDSCESYGCRLKGKFSLEYCDWEVTSSYIAHIVTCGEMGSVSCHTEEDADLIRSIRSHGREPNSIYFNHIIY